MLHFGYVEMPNGCDAIAIPADLAEDRTALGKTQVVSGNWVVDQRMYEILYSRKTKRLYAVLSA